MCMAATFALLLFQYVRLLSPTLHWDAGIPTLFFSKWSSQPWKIGTTVSYPTTGLRSYNIFTGEILSGSCLVKPPRGALQAAGIGSDQVLRPVLSGRRLNCHWI